MYLKKNGKKIVSSIAAAMMIGFAVLMPMYGAAAVEVQPVSSAAQDVSAAVESVGAVTVSTSAVTDASVSADTTPAVSAPAIIEAANPVPSSEGSADIAPSITDSVAESSVQAGSISAEASQDIFSQNANGEQKSSGLMLLVLLIGLVIVVVVIVAISTAVSSVSVAVDDEDE